MIRDQHGHWRTCFNTDNMLDLCVFVSCCVRQIRVGFLLVSRLKADSDRRVSAVSIIKSVFQYYVKCVLCVSRCGLLMLKMLKVKKNQEIDSNIVGFCLFMDSLEKLLNLRQQRM